MGVSQEKKNKNKKINRALKKSVPRAPTELKPQHDVRGMILQKVPSVVFRSEKLKG